MQIQICENHDPRGQGGATIGGSSFTQEYIEKIFKNLLLKNYWARKAQIKMGASTGSVDSNLFKSWSPGVGWGHNWGIKLYIGIYREILKNYQARKAQIKMGASSDSVESRLFKSQSLVVWWGHIGGMDFYIGIYRENL